MRDGTENAVRQFLNWLLWTINCTAECLYVRTDILVISLVWCCNLNKTCNVRITQHWGASLFPWKSNMYYIFWVCVCSLRYPAFNAHAPYCHPWPARPYSIFLHYLINGTIKKNLFNIKCFVFIFSTTFVWNISHSKNNWARYDQKCMMVFVWGTLFCQILMKLEFSHMFPKYTRIPNFMKIRPVGADLFHADGQTDMTKANRRFSQLREKRLKVWRQTSVKGFRWWLIRSPKFLASSMFTLETSWLDGNWVHGLTMFDGKTTQELPSLMQYSNTA